MSNKKTLITLISLGLALETLIKKSPADFQPALIDFKKDFDEYGNQPLPRDPELNKLTLANQDLVSKLTAAQLELTGKQTQVDSLITQHSAFKTESGNAIKDLKTQLEAALDVKAVETGVVTVTIDKVKYIINHGCHPYSKAELAENPDFCKNILAIEGQNALTKLK